MIHYKYIPPNDKLNIRLFGLLRMYLGKLCIGICNFTKFLWEKNNFFFVFLDETQYMQLIPYPLLDGTRDYTLPKGISYKCAISRKKMSLI